MNAVKKKKLCTSCGKNSSSSTRRKFSEQAWTMLLAWGEIANKDTEQPICEECYWELREVLIDRASEVTSTEQPRVKTPATAKVS